MLGVEASVVGVALGGAAWPFWPPRRRPHGSEPTELARLAGSPSRAFALLKRGTIDRRPDRFALFRSPFHVEPSAVTVTRDADGAASHFLGAGYRLDRAGPPAVEK